MSHELPEWRALRFTGATIPPEELQPLVDSVREAFSLARRGYSALGYRRLREARTQARLRPGQDQPWSRELLRCWDQAVRWYERLAAPPPH